MPPDGPQDYAEWCAVLDRVTRAQAKAVTSQDMWTRLLHADMTHILDRIVTLTTIVLASGEAAGRITQDRDRLRAENERLRAELATRSSIGLD